MSDNDSSQAVRAVQESVLNLIELVEHAARTQEEIEVEVVREEAQKTVLMMIAAIVLADDKYDAGEQAFVKLLVDASQKEGGEARYLSEYAENWKSASLQVPRFFQLALEHDTFYQTDLARQMIREIQIIGNNTCVNDGCFDAREHDVIRKYILFWEEYLTVWRAQHQAPKVQTAQGWNSV